MAPKWLRRSTPPSLAPSERHRLDVLCEFRSQGASQAERVFWFVNLVDWLRPRDGRPGGPRFRYFVSMLARHPEWHDNVSAALTDLVTSVQVPDLLVYAGIPSDFHFAGAVADWSRARILPSACDTTEAAEIIALAFREGDARWLSELSDQRALFALVAPSALPKLHADLRQSAVDLAHQIVAQAHAPSVRRLTTMERSPFRGLYDAVRELEATPDRARASALEGRLLRCLEAIEQLREGLLLRGADVDTTFRLERLRRQLNRLRLLGGLLYDASPERVGSALVSLVSATTRAFAGKGLFERSADLLVQNLVDTAASVGRDYLDDSRSASLAAFRAGAGGGLLMAIATVTKMYLHRIHLPALYEGLVYSLNYASVFCAAYLLHYTIATKLPAHTAAALVRDVQAGSSHRERLSRFVATWRAMVRLQVAGIAGNLVVAAPVGAALAWSITRVHGSFLTPREAEGILAQQSLLGPSLAFAALTGVMLWASSLIGAMVDNWARVTRLTDRLATNVKAMRLGHAVRNRDRAARISGAVGGLSANVALGFMLGAIPAWFSIAHLPIEIRHVTVSASSVAMAWVTGAGTAETLSLAVAGVVGIGLVNVLVSFMLAVMLALRSTRGLRTSRTANALVRIGIRRWWRAQGPRWITPTASRSNPAVVPAPVVDRSRIRT